MRGGACRAFTFTPWGEFMRIIGLTGGIGTGKSTVSGFLSKLGASVLEADKVGHEALEPASPIYDAVIAAFGKGILTPGGKISRKKLGEIVFASPVNLRRLNRIMHPWIFETLRERLEGLRRQGAKVVVVEAALLIEANWLPLVDEVWVTVAPGETIVKRLREREGLSEEEILSRIHSQMPQEGRLRYAAVVIDTNVSLEELKKRVAGLWAEKVKRVGS